MKTIIFSSFLLVGLISEFSLAHILEQGIFGSIQDFLINAYVKLPPIPILDDGKIKWFYPNFLGETLEGVEQRLPKYVTFNLYTPKNPTVPQKLYPNDTDSLKNSHFDVRNPTRFFCHGWIQTSTTRFSLWIRDEFLKHGNYNVIMLDWTPLTINMYPFTVQCIPKVAEYLANFTMFLMEYGMQVDDVHFIGHSLGAHVVGLASRRLKKKVPHVVGVDPAVPGFEKARKDERISKEDADYVQIIHGTSGHLGFSEPLGHSDYYANGGSQQPICKIDLLWFCSHIYTLYYYGESINNKKGFWARKCDNYDDYKSGKCHSNPASIMGTDEPDVNATGVFFFDTAEAYPYALGLEGIADK